MKKLFLSLGILFAMGLTNTFAQDYVGTYSGTLTFTPVVFPMDIDNFNREIENQLLNVSEDELFFAQIPLLKDTTVVNIGFTDVVFASNGDISAPDIEGGTNGITLVFSIVSGNISGNTINLNFQAVDKLTNGILAKVTANYTGTKQTSDIREISTIKTEKTVVAYYNIAGQKLNKAPQKGLYIVRYSDGTSEKILKQN